MKISFIALLVPLLATAVPFASQLPTAPLAILLSLTDDKNNIKVNVTNLDVDAIDIIAIHTPLSTEDLGGYRISYQDYKNEVHFLPYQGFINSYVTANLTQFHKTIGPSETLAMLFPLNQFDFANSSGPYSLSASGMFQYRPTNATADSEYFFGKYESNIVSFPNPPTTTQKFRRSNLTSLVFTEGCTEDKIKSINQAGRDFGQLADAAVNALSGAEDPAFKEFFGAASPTRYRTITGRFYNLQGAKQYANADEQQPEKFQFSCQDEWNHCVNKDGSENIGAYVHAPERNTVELCPLFFSSRVLPLSYLCSNPSYHPSDDSHYYRGATLLHEFMHLESVMNSQPLDDQKNPYSSNPDRVYGYALCKRIASGYPSLAFKNPDNYKYFAQMEYARQKGKGVCTHDEL